MKEIGPAENVVSFTNGKLVLLWAENKHWQRACYNFLREINNIPNKRLWFLRAKWILPHIIKVTPIFVAIIYCADANKSEEEGYKAGKIKKIVQSHYISVHKQNYMLLSYYY